MTIYQDVLDGLHAAFAAVPGIVNVLDYVPAAIHDTPTLYTMLDSVEVSKTGQIKTRRYRILHRLILLWQDNEQAELAVAPFVDSIPAALDADPQLGGKIASGWAEIASIDAVWVTIQNVEYRALDFYSEVLVKG
jgi:hypothetical protein